MSNSWLVGSKNGGCDHDSCGGCELSNRPVPIGSRNGPADSRTLLRNTEIPVEVDAISERQDGARRNEEKQTYDTSGNMMNTENVMINDGMYDRNIVVPGFVQNNAIDAKRLTSPEWVMTAGEFGQVLLEIPDDPIDDFRAESAHLSAKQVKADLRDIENGTLSGNDWLDICSPRPLKKSVMDVELESLSNTDFTLFECSSDKAGSRNCDQVHFKLDNPNLLHIIEIVQQKHPLEIDINDKNTLEHLNGPQTSSLQTLPLAVKKHEVVCDSSVLNLQRITVEKLQSVTTASNSCFSEGFAVANYENTMNANASSEIEGHLCQIIDGPSVDYNDVLPLCHIRSCKQEEEAILSSSQCTLRSNAAMDLVLESSVFIKDGFDDEIKKQVLTCGAGNALASTFKDCFNIDCVGIVTPSPDVGFDDQSGIQNPMPVNVLSVVSIAESMNAAVATAADESVKMHPKQPKNGQKSQCLSSSSAGLLELSATDFATSRKVVLKGLAVIRQSSIVPDIDRHEGEEVSCNETESKKFLCSQEDCDWSFPTAYKLRRHEETHEGRKDFTCSIDGCNKKFTTIYNLKTHLRLHKLPCTEVCPQPSCTQTFRNKRLLDKHMKLHSNGEKTYKCPHPGCTKTFFSQTSIGSHARVHQHDSELICAFDGCGRKFDKLCRLKQHMRCHTGERPYRCTVDGCNWAFSTSSRLSRHLQMHNGQKKWSCPFDGCTKLFTRAEHVRGHLVTHSSQRPFMCMNKGCDARFKSKNSLDIHLKRHSQMDKRPKGVLFYCPHEDCSHKFSTKAQLRAHMDNHEADHSSHQLPGQIQQQGKS